MPKSSGTIEEGFINFIGGTQADITLEEDTFGRGKIQLAIVEPLATSGYTGISGGPQPPGTSYLSGSMGLTDWVFYQNNHATPRTAPSGEFISFTTVPDNVGSGTTGAIALGNGTASGAIYLLSNPNYLYDEGTYDITFALCHGSLLDGINGTWVGSLFRFLGRTKTNIAGTGLAFGGANTWVVPTGYKKSHAGITGPYTDVQQGPSGNYVRREDLQGGNKVTHFKVSITLTEESQIGFYWSVPGAQGLNTHALGLCETIIEKQNEDYGYNYGGIQIASQFIDDKTFRIYTSAPFWGRIAYSVSS